VRKRFVRPPNRCTASTRLPTRRKPITNRLFRRPRHFQRPVVSGACTCNQGTSRDRISGFRFQRRSAAECHCEPARSAFGAIERPLTRNWPTSERPFRSSNRLRPERGIVDVNAVAPSGASGTQEVSRVKGSFRGRPTRFSQAKSAYCLGIRIAALPPPASFFFLAFRPNANHLPPYCFGESVMQRAM